jgi:hypothetical protein
VSRKGLGAICIVETQLGCAAVYNNCLNDALAGYDKCAMKGLHITDPRERQNYLDNCWYIWKLDTTECAAEYVACGLGALLPF